MLIRNGILLVLDDNLKIDRHEIRNARSTMLIRSLVGKLNELYITSMYVFDQLTKSLTVTTKLKARKENISLNTIINWEKKNENKASHICLVFLSGLANVNVGRKVSS